VDWVAERYFSPGEVEALIPELTTVMGEVMERHEALSGLRESVDEERQRLSMVGGGVPAGTWREDAARVARVTKEIQERLERIVALGGVPKDLSTGLVDFAHLREGREVNLCWQYGEREIRFWHGLDEGYSARKRL
jgi:hypothetical protein